MPVSLPSLLSETSWRRCEAVLSAAFSGVPAQASGAIVLQSGETFCHHMICTSFVSLSGERQAVLVQFDLEEHGQDEIVTLPEPARNEIRSAKSARDLDLLEHFPDDVLVFDGSESFDEMAGKLLKLINSDYGMDLLAEAWKIWRANCRRPSIFRKIEASRQQGT